MVTSFTPRDDQMGVPGVVYGGLIASLIDCHGIATGAAHFQDHDELAHPPRCVTASLHVEYRKPTPMGDAAMDLIAEVVEASERKAVVDVEVREEQDLDRLNVGLRNCRQATFTAVKKKPVLRLSRVDCDEQGVVSPRPPEDFVGDAHSA